MVKRYYVHKFSINGAILIDTVKRTWTFYNTNIYGQVYNLDEKPKKITKQRISGLIKRMQGFYDSLNGYVVDQYVYNYIMDEEQRKQCFSEIEIKDYLIASGNDLKEVLTKMCKYLLEDNNLSDRVDNEYYINKINNVA